MNTLLEMCFKSAVSGCPNKPYNVRLPSIEVWLHKVPGQLDVLLRKICMLRYFISPSL